MGLVETASGGNSVWRGMDYYNEKKVISWELSGRYTYDGLVSGSEGQRYTVHVDKAHPRRSTCNCAFANGRRVVCKHMIAVYFTAEPEAAEDFLEDVRKWESQENERQEQHYQDLKKYVMSLKKAELQERLLDAMIELEKGRNYW